MNHHELMIYHAQGADAEVVGYLETNSGEIEIATMWAAVVQAEAAIRQAEALERIADKLDKLTHTTEVHGESIKVVGYMEVN